MINNTGREARGKSALIGGFSRTAHCKWERMGEGLNPNNRHETLIPAHTKYIASSQPTLRICGSKAHYGKD